MPDAAALNAVADILDAHPDLYRQADLYHPTDCGTACCIAGWAVARAMVADGALAAPEDVSWLSATEWVEATRDRLERWGGSHVCAARDMLGLDSETASYLFGFNWRPAAGMNPGDALRALAAGQPIAAVTFDIDGTHREPMESFDPDA